MNPSRRSGMLAWISVATSKNGSAAGGEANAPVETAIHKPYPKIGAAEICEVKYSRIDNAIWQ
jgi:hypothetical protein